MLKKIYRLFLIIAFPYLLHAQTDPVIWTKHIISNTVDGVKKLAVVNLDNDTGKNLDIVVTANPENNGTEDVAKPNVIWFKNLGDMTFEQHEIDMIHVGARGLAAGDLTGDDFADLVVGSKIADSALIWYKNDGSPDVGDWARIKIGGRAPNNYIVKLVDLDKDGLLDIVDGIGDDADFGSAGSGTVTDSVRWIKNMGGLDTATFQTNLIALYPSPSGIAIADFDGDSDLDVAGMAWTNYLNLIAVNEEDVRWWANSGNGNWTQQQILQTAYGGNDLIAADMDKNGTIDLVGSGYKNQSLDWWSNDGQGTFSAIHVIASNFTYTRNVFPEDIDSDGDMDVAATADNSNKICWFENDGAQNFTEHILDSQFTYAYFTVVEDMDGDGDKDIIGTAQNADQLAWWESDLAEEQILLAGNPDSAYFNNNAVVIDFKENFTGGKVSVFYQNQENFNKNSLGAGIDHIAANGYYTIYARASSYLADAVFYYSGIPQWNGVATNDNDLRICYWDETSGINGEWILLGDLGQVVDSLNARIIVRGIDSKFLKYSRITMASVSTISSLNEAVIAFGGASQFEGVELRWTTKNEQDLAGFEIWRKNSRNDEFSLLSSHQTDPSLLAIGLSTGSEYRFVDRFTQYGNSYTYRLYQVDTSGNRAALPDMTVLTMPSDAVKIFGLELSQTTELNQNYPNPFNSSTLIEFAVPAQLNQTAAQVELKVFNILGQKVRTLFSGQLSSGRYLMRWDGRDDHQQRAASGTYIYALIVDGKSAVRKLSLIY